MRVVGMKPVNPILQHVMFRLVLMKPDVSNQKLPVHLSVVSCTVNMDM